MNGFIAKSLLILLLAVAMTGCKLAVIVVEGGEVQSTFGTCQPAVPGTTGTVCIHEVTSPESFTAVPDPGWYFVKWNTGGDFLCADSASPICVVAELGPHLEPPVASASDKTLYIMPVFAPGTTITNTVTHGGMEWAQVNLFSGLSRDQIDSVCSGGPCVEGGVLNGLDMTGWRWATREEVGDLFALFTPHPGGIDEYSQYFGSPISQGGFYETALLYLSAIDSPIVAGEAVCGYASGSGSAGIANYNFVYREGWHIVSTTGGCPGFGFTFSVGDGPGGWFYRTP